MIRDIKYFERLARKLGRELIIWNKLTKEEQESVLSNPEKYFILVDLPLSIPKKIKGIPQAISGGC